jgi:hypothetical protein
MLAIAASSPMSVNTGFEGPARPVLAGFQERSLKSAGNGGFSARACRKELGENTKCHNSRTDFATETWPLL